MYGLVAPGYAMAEVVVDALLDGPGAFTGADMSTKLKLLGVDVASFGDAFATTDGRARARLLRRRRRRLQEARRSARTAPGCSAASSSATPRRTACSDRWSPAASRCPANPEELILPGQPSGGVQLGMPDEAQVCSCNNVTKGADLHAVSEDGCETVADVKKCTRAGSTCGSCVQRRQEPHRGALRERRQGRRQGPVRALPAQPPGALRRGRGARLQAVRRHRRGARQRPRLRHLQAGDREHPGQPVQRPRARPREPAAAGHQRRLPRQHPAQRHLLRRPAHPRRRDHAREADRRSARWPATSTSTRRSPAASGSTCSAPGWRSCRRSGGGSSTPASSPATPTASRCAR